MKTLVQRLAGCVLVLAFSAVACAHAQLDHASPAVGSQADATPTEVKIWFDADVDPAGTSI
jgi:methionine-rich copper-binding protein CopC